VRRSGPPTQFGTPAAFRGFLEDTGSPQVERMGLLLYSRMLRLRIHRGSKEKNRTPWYSWLNLLARL